MQLISPNASQQAATQCLKGLHNSRIFEQIEPRRSLWIGRRASIRVKCCNFSSSVCTISFCRRFYHSDLKTHVSGQNKPPAICDTLFPRRIGRARFLGNRFVVVVEKPASEEVNIGRSGSQLPCQSSGNCAAHGYRNRRLSRTTCD